MYYTGIDIGSSAAKVVLMKDPCQDENFDRNNPAPIKPNIACSFSIPTGWNCKDTAQQIKEEIESQGISLATSKTVATGYGRISVPYADKIVSEISCHGLGASYLFTQNATIMDIGGQDTKIITLRNGKVVDFLMNDKCSAGTGKFIEIMSNRLGLSIPEFCSLAEKGSPITINSMCTVFAESEVIGFIGKGEPRENIALGILDSVVCKVVSLGSRHGLVSPCFLTGGLSESPIILKLLSEKLNAPVTSSPMGKYAGAIGAALLAKNLAK